MQIAYLYHNEMDDIRNEYQYKWYSAAESMPCYLSRPSTSLALINERIDSNDRIWNNHTLSNYSKINEYILSQK